MTQLETTELGTLEEPVPIPSLPFAQTIDVSGRTARPDEPSPCLPSAASDLVHALPPGLVGTLVVDLSGSTPHDPVVRLYRVAGPTTEWPTFLAARAPSGRAARPRGPRRGGRHRARPGRHVGVARRAPRRARRGAAVDARRCGRGFTSHSRRPSRRCSSECGRTYCAMKALRKTISARLAARSTVRTWPGRGVRAGRGGWT